jgi:hypothetical protein
MNEHHGIGIHDIIKQVAWVTINIIHYMWNLIHMQFNYNYVGVIIV